MKYAFILLLLAGCALVPQDDSVSLTPKQQEICAAQGGCAVVTRRVLEAIAQRAVAQACGKGI